MTVINIHREKFPTEHVADTGGEYAEATLDVYIDSSLTPEMQGERLVHAILEHFLFGFPHSKIEELTEAITDGLASLTPPTIPTDT